MGLQLSSTHSGNQQLSSGNYIFLIKLFTVSISVFVMSLIYLAPIYAQWSRTNGPEGVAISSLANIDGIIYAGTEVNGVYISPDDGISWIARNTGIETYEVTSIIGFQNLIFAGTFGGGVYRSGFGARPWLVGRRCFCLWRRLLWTGRLCWYEHSNQGQ